MASPPTANQIATAPDEQSILPDEVLEVIFLHLDSGLDLARASATCRAFRRVATGRSFLRRFTSRHPPPVVGCIEIMELRGEFDRGSFFPAEPTHGSAPAARALAQAGDYRFSFLPEDTTHYYRVWRVCDVRDGRFLLSRDAIDGTNFLELVVADPLYRRYVQIPPIPGDLVPRVLSIDEMKSDPFFGPSDEEDLEKVSHFRVIYNWLSNYKIHSFLYSAATGKWCYSTSFKFLPIRYILGVKSLKRYYARGCFYLTDLSEQYMLKLDPCEMKFSLVPHDENCRPGLCSQAASGLAVIDAGEDRLGLLTVRDRTLYLYTITKPCQNNGVGAAQEWRHDKSISLPNRPYKNYYILGATDGYLLLQGSSYDPHEEVKIYCFTVNLETFVVQRLCALDDPRIHCCQPYTAFPKPLSLPSL